MISGTKWCHPKPSHFSPFSGLLKSGEHGLKHAVEKIDKNIKRSQY